MEGREGDNPGTPNEQSDAELAQAAAELQISVAAVKALADVPQANENLIPPGWMTKKQYEEIVQQRIIEGIAAKMHETLVTQPQFARYREGERQNYTPIQAPRHGDPDEDTPNPSVEPIDITNTPDAGLVAGGIGIGSTSNPAGGNIGDPDVGGPH